METAISIHRCGIHSILVDQLFFSKKWAWMKSKLMRRFSVFPLGKTPTELSKNWIRLMKGLTSLVLFESKYSILWFICAHTQKKPHTPLDLAVSYSFRRSTTLPLKKSFKEWRGIDISPHSPLLTVLRINGSDMCKSFSKPQRKPSFSAGKFKPHSLSEISLYCKWEPFVKQTQ